MLCNAVNTVDATQEDPFLDRYLNAKAINSDETTYSVLLTMEKLKKFCQLVSSESYSTKNLYASTQLQAILIMENSRILST